MGFGKHSIISEKFQLQLSVPKFLQGRDKIGPFSLVLMSPEKDINV